MLKKLLFTFSLLCAAAFTSSAQIEGSQTRAGDISNIINYIPDSLVYALPEFSSGILIYEDGSVSRGLMNICNIDQKIMFRNEEGKLAVLTENNKVTHASIGGKHFIHHQGMFFNVKHFDTDGLALVHSLTIFNDVKEDAYGMVSETSSIYSYSGIYAGGQVFNLSSGTKYPYKYKITPYLYHNGKFLRITKRNLSKVFPDKKEEIREYFRSSGDSYDSYPQIADFVNFLMNK